MGEGLGSVAGSVGCPNLQAGIYWFSDSLQMMVFRSVI